MFRKQPSAAQPAPINSYLRSIACSATCTTTFRQSRALLLPLLLGAMKLQPPAGVLAWFASTRTFLLDCDGVLWKGTAPIPGAAESVAYLRAAGKRVLFVTNNSTKSRVDYVDKLSAMCGIPASAGDILSSAFAAATYARTAGLQRAYVIGQAGLHEEMQAAGLTTLGAADFDKPFAFGTLRPSDLDPAVDCVVVGFDGQFSYYKLNMAAAYLRYGAPRVAFIATNRDATFPDTHMVLAGGGTLVSAVETAAGRPPDVVAGKPSTALLDILEAAEPDVHRAHCCMVGDRLDTDIAFGNAGKLGSTLLVMTGVTHEADLEAITDDLHRPRFVLPSFADLVGVLEAARKLA